MSKSVFTTKEVETESIYWREILVTKILQIIHLPLGTKHMKREDKNSVSTSKYYNFAHGITKFGFNTYTRLLMPIIAFISKN